MHENFCIIRPQLADDTALLYCVFNDPWESYCPWNLIIFTRKFKTRKPFVVGRRNQLESDKWPLTLKMGQGQRSRSSSYHYSLCCLSAKKKNYALLHIQKLFWPFHSTCWKNLKSYALWTLTFHEVIDILRKILVIGLCRKPLSLHAWKSMYNKSIISWKHCSFVLHVRWPIRELLPLKLDIFYAKI
jgi:hypothetical protein